MKREVVYSWDRLGITRDEWWSLAGAFYGLAHGMSKDFLALPDKLKQHPVGQICTRYLETEDHNLINEAGYALTHTKHWYVYIGRCM